MTKSTLVLLTVCVLGFAACGDNNDSNNLDVNNTNNANNSQDMTADDMAGDMNVDDMGEDMDPSDTDGDMIENEATFVATETILKVNKIDDGNDVEDIKEIDIKIAVQCTDSPSYRISWDLPRESKIVAEFKNTEKVTLDYATVDDNADTIKLEKLSYVALDNDLYETVKSGKIIVAAVPQLNGVAKDELTLDADITFTLSNTSNPEKSDVVFAMDLEYYFKKHPCDQ